MLKILTDFDLQHVLRVCIFSPLPPPTLFGSLSAQAVAIDPSNCDRHVFCTDGSCMSLSPEDKSFALSSP
ncbi:hypothetical protein T4E_892 [Trichinella pseudospiralis]|uniref:Uncharacterized protein n=1 Tax=Trichinella pseudospiralis TaxID=6337 RepID=A0A0V0XTZ0_TRIPS|nr:hypothetical protein T4E_892 [Trichinella pseudospiralis]